MEELLSGTKAKLNNEPVNNSVFVHPLPFNLIPHIDKFQVRKSTIIPSQFLPKYEHICFLLFINCIGKWIYKRRNESSVGNIKDF